MSLKSFDDFCAKMVNNEPLNYSAVYFDERQKIVRSKILIETLTLFGIAVTLNTLIMEWGLKWCEGYFAPIAVFMALCYLYYILRSVKQGTLFGVENPPSTKVGAIFCIIECIYFPLMNFTGKDSEFLAAKDGMLTTHFVLLIFYVIAVIDAILVLIFYNLHKKAEKAEVEENNDNQKSGKA